MAPEPPSFASVEYWDARFDKEPTTFEWLQDPRALRQLLVQSIEESRNLPPRILHIGCGTSALSILLRSLVTDPSTICNTDFSQVAIELGKQREQEVLANEADHFPDPSSDHRLMQWVTLDLLSLDCIADLLASGDAARYDLILDKSTSDAVACGEDLLAALPYPLQVEAVDSPMATTRGRSPTPPPSTQRDIARVHPVHVLAVHLAYLAAPGARWIAVSYASHRFPFLPPYPEKAVDGRLSRWMEEAGFAHPKMLWELERKDEIVTEVANPGPAQDSYTSHTLYVLRRTPVRLRMASRSSHERPDNDQNHARLEF